MSCAFSESTRLSEYSETSFLQTALKRLRLLDDFISIPRFFFPWQIAMIWTWCTD